jgi:hypothetical protein
MPPFVPPFLAGLVVAPVAKRIVKPLLKGIVKTSVGLVLEVKKAAQEAGEGIQGLAAEVAAEKSAGDLALESDDMESGPTKVGAAAPAPVPATAGSGAKSH